MLGNNGNIIMKNLVLTALVAFSLIIYSCGSSKNTSGSGSDKNINSLVKKLNRNPDDMQAQSDLKFVYAQSVKEHEDKINAYKYATTTDRWDNIINEMNALQMLYNTINSSVAASRAAKPKSYFSDIQAVS